MTIEDLPRIAITMGDINGIGPEILAKAMAHAEVRARCQVVIAGCPHALEAARAFAPGCPPATVDAPPFADAALDAVVVHDGGFPAPPMQAGQLSAEAGRCAVEWLKVAVGWALAGTVDAVVTCPINKVGIHAAGYAYPGHTEILSELCGHPDWRMSLFADNLRIVHVSGHLSLRQALDALSIERIANSIRIGHDALGRLNLPRRKIAVAGLNPHAGESGAFGDEESTLIAPAIAQCREEGIDCHGPCSPDAVFRQGFEGDWDLIVAMYHDQGHIALKMVEMDSGVNVSLGLPIVRTSVDHGTAYDIAGKGVAREDSLLAAIRLAVALSKRPNARESR